MNRRLYVKNRAPIPVRETGSKDWSPSSSPRPPTTPWETKPGSLPGRALWWALPPARTRFGSNEAIHRGFPLDSLGRLHPASPGGNRTPGGTDRGFLGSSTSGGAPGQSPGQKISLRGVGPGSGSMGRRSMSPCVATWSRASKRPARRPSPRCWFPTGPSSSRTVFPRLLLVRQRHAAHAAGLGTFGLCDGLITAKGKAMRAGSVVARIAVAQTPRPMPTTGPIASISPRELAAAAWTVARSERLPRPATTKRSVGNIWSGPGPTWKKPISSWAMVAACARWGCLARRVSRSRPPGKPWSAASCRPHRRPWPEDIRLTRSSIFGFPFDPLQELFYNKVVRPLGWVAEPDMGGTHPKGRSVQNNLLVADPTK